MLTVGSRSGRVKVGGALEEERDAGERAQVRGLVVGRDLTLPLVATVLEPDLHLKSKKIENASSGMKTKN